MLMYRLSIKRSAHNNSKMLLSRKVNVLNLFTFNLAIGIAFESLTYDVRENDKKAIVEISVESGKINTPLTFK